MRPLPPQDHLRNDEIAAQSERLKQLLQGNVVLVGIGQVLKGDDGAGPLLAQKLQGKTRALCLDAGTAPESYIGKIAAARPDVVMIVDAAHMGIEAGGWRLLEKAQIVESGLTTHDISPRLFVDFLEGRTGAKVCMLGIQPSRLSLGDELSPAVAGALDQLERTLTELLHA